MAAISNDPANLALQVEGLCFAYPQGNNVLDQLRFSISKGERVGLVGPNGAGKTTLFLCLAGVLNVPAGVIRLTGLDPAVAAERRQLPSRVGIVFQNSDDQLFSTTLADDVAFGPLNLGLAADEVRRRVTESLQRVGLKDQEKRAPFHLSGGEKRRAALAGVLAMRPEVLLLDEPSMFLDPRSRRELMTLLTDLPGTQIVAAHDLDMILHCCQRVLLLERGRLMADGRVREVLGDSELLERHGLEVPYRLRK
jgi:cobalt/nickel transport system ATP-binding protein